MVTESRGVVVARVMSGPFMTSLEMAGVSLTLMKANPETLRLFGKQFDAHKPFILHHYFKNNNMEGKVLGVVANLNFV